MRGESTPTEGPGWRAAPSTMPLVPVAEMSTGPSRAFQLLSYASFECAGTFAPFLTPRGDRQFVSRQFVSRQFVSMDCLSRSISITASW